MLLLNLGPKVPSRAPRAPPALHRSEKEGGHRPPEPSGVIKYNISYLRYKKVWVAYGHPPSHSCRGLGALWALPLK